MLISADNTSADRRIFYFEKWQMIAVTLDGPVGGNWVDALVDVCWRGMATIELVDEMS